VTRDERQEFVKILQAHAQTIAICEACAATTRDLAGEVGRGSVPARADLINAMDQAEQVLKDLTSVREEVERLIAAFR
jgi:sulfur relay (sulfurtransferase) complex TusBCD TusD component (DsrE family)